MLKCSFHAVGGNWCAMWPCLAEREEEFDMFAQTRGSSLAEQRKRWASGMKHGWRRARCTGQVPVIGPESIADTILQNPHMFNGSVNPVAYLPPVWFYSSVLRPLVSVRYEDPGAVEGLAGALDTRLQVTAGVCSLSSENNSRITVKHY